MCYAVKYKVLLTLYKWARYADRINRQDLTRVNYYNY